MIIIGSFVVQVEKIYEIWKFIVLFLNFRCNFIRINNYLSTFIDRRSIYGIINIHVINMQSILQFIISTGHDNDIMQINLHLWCYLRNKWINGRI